MRLTIDIAQSGPALHPHLCLMRIDMDAAHLRQVDHQPAIAERPPADIMPAAPHRQRTALRGGKAHARDHIRRATRAQNGPGMTLDQAVTDMARSLIIRGAGADQRPAHRLGKSRQSRLWHRFAMADHEA